MDHSHSFDMEAAASLHDREPSDESIVFGEIEEASLEDGVSSDEESASVEIEEAVSLEDGDSSAEEITQENSLVHSMREKLNAFPLITDTIDGPTIFRVPCSFRKNKEHLIEPVVVSIGPYHRGRDHLALMEDKKWLLFKDILSRPNAKVTLEACVERLKGIQSQARNYYSERVDMDDDSFVEMLILDGTFIIQYACKPYKWFQRQTGWAFECIKTDLILLENQIPLFVVQSLFDLYSHGLQKYATTLGLLIKRLCPKSLLSRDIAMPQYKFHHLLHLCHHSLVPDMSAHVSVLPGCSCFDFCRCVSSKHENANKLPGATELKNAGIKFRKKKSLCKMMDITFQGGTLEIPSINIYDETKTLIINLLAFEQSRVYSVPRFLSSYASFMDSIINTEHDVAILQRHGIIANHLSGEEEVALFFNQLCEGVVQIKGHYLSNLINEVNRYYDSKCHRYRAKLMRDYFNSPWSLISFIAAVIILGLTFAQTYFAGDTYFHPSF